jgi:hypothetical protein
VTTSDSMKAAYRDMYAAWPYSTMSLNVSYISMTGPSVVIKWVLGSNLGPVTGYSDTFFFRFSPVPPRKWWDNT